MEQGVKRGFFFYRINVAGSAMPERLRAGKAGAGVARPVHSGIERRVRPALRASTAGHRHQQVAPYPRRKRSLRQFARLAATLT
jgi:hypothetical protein